MPSMIRIQMELPVDVINKTYSYLQNLMVNESEQIDYNPLSEWRLILATVRDFDDEAVPVIRDYARSACKVMRSIGLSITMAAIDKAGNISLPISGSVSELEACISHINDKFKSRTDFNIGFNTNQRIIVGRILNNKEERTMNFRRPVSWTANSIYLTNPGDNGFDQRLFVIFLDGGKDAAVHG